MRTAIEGGMADALAEFNALRKDKVDTGQVGAAQFFGTAADTNGNCLYRMAGAVLGIYGNTAAAAMYPSFANDSAGAPLTGANHYTFRFAPMLTSLVPDPDGGYTFDIQNTSPGIEKQSNWLPAPNGPFMLVLRLYWPKPDALNGVWKAPQPVRA